MTYVPNANSFSVDGRTINDKELIFGMCAITGSTSTGTFVESNSTAGYVVPASKTLRIIGVRIQASTAGSLALCYSDNDMGFGGTTAPTNPVYCYGPSANISSSQPAVSEKAYVSCQFDVPTGKYPGIVAGTCYGQIEMIGYLY